MDEPIIPTSNNTNDPFASMNAPKPAGGGMNLNNMGQNKAMSFGTQAM